MPLLNDGLPLWEIAFRWAHEDPKNFWLRIPLPVRDNFRLLMDAILRGHLPCETLSLEKWRPDSEAPPELFIRYFIDDAYKCIAGLHFNRKLLRHAMIERWAMQQWCERQGVPLPEFWFPPGWNTYYEWQDPNADELPEEAVPIDTTGGSAAPTALDPDFPPAKRPAEPAPPTTAPMSEDESQGRRKLDQRQRRKIACQEVAIRVWFKNPEADVKVIANSPEVQDLAGGSESDFDVLLRWLGEVDPRDPGKRRGPKRKK
jgi:hypothetical protein